MNAQESSENGIQYLLDYSRNDWVGMSVVVAEAGSRAGAGATFEQMVDSIVVVVGDLMDHGAVPGDLTREDPGFSPWSGSKQRILDRLAEEIRSLGQLPDSGEICWIHIPETRDVAP